MEEKELNVGVFDTVIVKQGNGHKSIAVVVETFEGNNTSSYEAMEGMEFRSVAAMRNYWKDKYGVKIVGSRMVSLIFPLSNKVFVFPLERVIKMVSSGKKAREIIYDLAFQRGITFKERFELWCARKKDMRSR